MNTPLLTPASLSVSSVSPPFVSPPSVYQTLVRMEVAGSSGMTSWTPEDIQFLIVNASVSVYGDVRNRCIALLESYAEWRAQTSWLGYWEYCIASGAIGQSDMPTRYELCGILELLNTNNLTYAPDRSKEHLDHANCIWDSGIA